MWLWGISKSVFAFGKNTTQWVLCWERNTASVRRGRPETGLWHSEWHSEDRLEFTTRTSGFRLNKVSSGCFQVFHLLLLLSDSPPTSPPRLPALNNHCGFKGTIHKRKDSVYHICGLQEFYFTVMTAYWDVPFSSFTAVNCSKRSEPLMTIVITENWGRRMSG